MRRPALTGSMINSRSHSAGMPSMFGISRSVILVGSIPSAIACTAMSRSRSSCTVERTSSSDLPSRSMRHTTTVSPGLAKPNNVCMPGRVRCSGARDHIRIVVLRVDADIPKRITLQRIMLAEGIDPRVTERRYAPIMPRQTPNLHTVSGNQTMGHDRLSPNRASDPTRHYEMCFRDKRVTRKFSDL